METPGETEHKPADNPGSDCGSYMDVGVFECVELLFLTSPGVWTWIFIPQSPWTTTLLFFILLLNYFYKLKVQFVSQ